MGRYSVFRDGADSALAVVDYWQNRVVTPETDGPDFLSKLPYDTRYCYPIPAQELARIYIAQQELAGQQ